ncbi:tRNA uridine-5-carboxymethylaminomethyl(34) synthesis GTPase MnmE [Psychroflexus montanilacus]|uniref:tRNA uridine-5-carboxymethylaminomethyl(34) synthesis GTPase MnmE n=1 Tax=Psychroflexus montanilacus TaxID=2873598 RepID=UPI001CCD701D|nr:tRNA uridine-5-carboxymethylaminomethyl(34) synthesis GTPase MnmE [Psychroflexus montanilacus]MBZ9650707.1 tRNA uridine-5-carboxymethylaminomethyl(34) synthesis GTPase MnmE [Psychroflexus montanilacus]
MINNDTIVALATASGSGAIAIIRVSGEKALEICNPLFHAKNKKSILDQKSHTLQLGTIRQGERILDEVLVSVFRGQRSYTGEPTVEISCHGSSFIQKEIIQLLISKGCRSAKPGEFTLRAFLNGKMDLSQAEAVADLVSSDNAASHQLAMQQMRGGFTHQLQELRQELLDFASLMELELDFSEEDVEFANREQFQALVLKIQKVLSRLIDSFAVGNVIKNGIPVAIVGEPNVGKSTLLNALLNEDRAIVSDIAGTTRDTIEDEISIGGIGFRFIDTAGIRETQDTIEGLGIQRTFEKIKQSQVIIKLIDTPRVFDANHQLISEEWQRVQDDITQLKEAFPERPFLLLANKADLLTDANKERLKEDYKGLLFISAKDKTGIEAIQDQLLSYVDDGALRNNDTIVTNSRHYNALLLALEEINKVQEGLNQGLTTDLLAIDIRQALYHFGEITGEVTNDELLGNIFANFCIGK